MQRQNKNNRSLLAIAGQQSLPASKTRSPAAAEKKPKVSELSLYLPLAQRSQLLPKRGFDVKEIVKRLGLSRLRKMQALVRGFLVRRKIYPKELKDYLIAQSALDLIVANVVYKEASGIVIETVTLGRYDQESLGQSRMLQEHLYNVLIRRVIQKEFEPIAKEAVYQTAMFASRPNITYGLNLRDPMELTLFLKVEQIIREYARQVAEQCLREQALERRQLQVIDTLIANMKVLDDLYTDIVDECLVESIDEYVVDNLMSKMAKQAAIVVSEVSYCERLGAQEDKFVEDLAVQAEEWLIQEAIAQIMVTDFIEQKQPKAGTT